MTSAATPLRLCFVSLPGRGVFLPDERTRVGGAEAQVKYLSTFVASQPNCEAHIIVEDSGQPECEEVDGVKLWRLCQPREGASRVGRLWRQTVSAINIRRQIRALRPTVCAQFSAGAETGITCSAAHSIGAGFVYLMASDSECDAIWTERSDATARLFRRGLARADVVIAQHDQQREAINNAYGRAAVTLPSLFPFPPPPERAGDRVLWIGRCGKPKAPERFLELARAIPEASFLMIAPPSDLERELFDRVSAASEQIENLEFIPGVEHTQTAEQYRRAGVLVNTSDYEGAPNTFFEATAHGLAIVSLRADPDKLMARDGGGINAGGEMDALVEATRALVNDEARRSELAARGRQVLEGRHEVSRVGPKFIEILRGG